MVIELLGATFLVAGFLLLFKLFNLAKQAGDAVTLSRAAFFEISRRDIDDDEKERNLRVHAVKLAVIFALLVTGGLAAAGLPVLLLWGLDYLGYVSIEAILTVAASWQFLLAATVFTLLVFWVPLKRMRQQKAESAEFENRYSATTRFMHSLAFVTTPAQLSLADLEDKLVIKKTDPKAAKAPVFITALPRAGTTLLLELCANTGEFATHSYRHMPFIFTPIFWQRFTKSMQTTGELRERAHGDGMLVNEDSPEAFEEMLWMAHWEDQYDKNLIRPWPQKDDPDFVTFFENHMRKIVHLGTDAEDTEPRRYVSKNNLNIARANWLLSALPTARVVIPFRDPLQHAESLLRQHLRFLSVHESDSFARSYMAGIGHFDFGDNLRPVNFDNWLEQADLPAASSINFWLSYWIAAYRHLLTLNSERVIFIDYDWLCHQPESSLRKLADFLQLNAPERLIRQHTRLELKPPRTIADTALDPVVFAEAQAVHEQLKSESLIGPDS